MPDPATDVEEVDAPCCEPMDAAHMVGDTGHSVFCRDLMTAERAEPLTSFEHLRPGDAIRYVDTDGKEIVGTVVTVDSPTSLTFVPDGSPPLPTEICVWLDGMTESPEHRAVRSRTDDEQAVLSAADRDRINDAVVDAWGKGLTHGRAGAARDIEEFERTAPGGPAVRGALLEAARIAREGVSGKPDTSESLGRRLAELRATAMPAAQFDPLAASVDEPDDAPKLAAAGFKRGGLIPGPGVPVTFSGAEEVIYPDGRLYRDIVAAFHLIRSATEETR